MLLHCVLERLSTVGGKARLNHIFYGVKATALECFVEVRLSPLMHGASLQGFVEQFCVCTCSLPLRQEREAERRDALVRAFVVRKLLCNSRTGLG
ncbi:MAG: hypothetical protein E7A10_05950 [Dermabacter sp.]|nr:hypothetical protein [Dermabacter sp.]